MPTSSQANILKGSDEGRNTSISYQFVKSPRRSPDKERKKSQSPDRKTCELVKFDFHVSSLEPSFEGVFAFDNKTNSCRWQIATISPTKQTDNSRNINQNLNQCDSFGNILNDHPPDDGNEISPASSIHEQPSEIKPHFTTPCASLIDTGIGPADFHVNDQSDLRGFSRSLKRPHFPILNDRLDPAIYRQFESFGLRFPKKPHSPRSAKDARNTQSPPSSACRCGISPLLMDSTPRLAINTLDPLMVPAPFRVPYKRQGFTSMMNEKNKRVIEIKQRSLIDEVKQSVHWDKRVTPTMTLRRGPVKAIPTAICFSLRNMHEFAHSDIKGLIEFRFRTQVKAIQYDPVSVRMSEPGSYDRWIVTLNSRSECDKVIQQGMTIDGDKVIIRIWDEVLQQEKIFGENIGFDYPCRYRLQKEMHNQVLKNFLATSVN